MNLECREVYVPEDVLTKARKRVEDERRGCNALAHCVIRMSLEVRNELNRQEYAGEE